MKISIFVTLTFLSVLLFSNFSSGAEAIKIDFEDGKTDAWKFIDDETAKPEGPSKWEIRDGKLDGKSLYQGSNIWGNKPPSKGTGKEDSCLLGTYAIYQGKDFTDFTMEMDVFAADNDGMGIVWGFTGQDKHHRVIMINDKWPSPALDKVGGPFMKLQQRVGPEEPWYKIIEVVKDDYKPYAEGKRLHWTLSVINGEAKFKREDGLSISAKVGQTTGKVGIQLYAQQADFDYIMLTPSIAAVDARGKLATTWSLIKSSQ